MIRILDYGLGNLRSVEKAVMRMGGEVSIATHVEDCDKLIIPGVGAFGAAMERIRPLAPAIHRFAGSNKPILGICLGQQLLFDRSEEMGDHRGLGLIPGSVRYLPKTSNLKIPHIGWSALKIFRHDGLGRSARDGDQVYFVHSLYTDCADASDVVATAEYGIAFPAAVQRGAIWGAQFHPEKSSDTGLRMLRSFIEC